MSDTPPGSATHSHPPAKVGFQVEEYFPIANRETILTHTTDALQRDASLIIWSGEEGSGKSTLCKVLEHRASSICSVVVFPSTVDSFEEVIRVLAVHLGIDLKVEINRKSVGECQETITQYLLDNELRLLVIFDEAENIYLATLERIRKLIDTLAEKGVNIHVVFSGRPTFLENCEQLSICDFQYTKEFILRLESISLEETGDYLRGFIPPVDEIETGEGFNDKVVAEIHNLSGGNFRQISILCKEALQTPDDHSFLKELPYKINNERNGQTGSPGLVSLSKSIKNSVLLPWLGAAGLTILALLYFTNFISEERVNKPVVVKEQTLENVEEIKNAPPEELPGTQALEKRAELIETAAVQEKSAVSEPVEAEKNRDLSLAVSPAEKLPFEETTASQNKANMNAEVVQDTIATQAAKEKRPDEVSVAEQVQAPVDAEKDQDAVVEVVQEEKPLDKKVAAEKSIERASANEQKKSPDIPDALEANTVAEQTPVYPEKTAASSTAETGSVEETLQLAAAAAPIKDSETPKPAIKRISGPAKEKIVVERNEIVELYPSADTKRNPNVEQPQQTAEQPQQTVKQPQQTFEQSLQTVEHLQQTDTKEKKDLTDIEDDTSVDGQFIIEKIYEERLSAGDSWKGGTKDSKYTVQLMVLTSKTAENNLKTMLLEDEYRQEADNFYIFKNNDQLETIFVFYGEYPTITQARQAQNSLPLFLKEHKPYALSIKGAIAKISR